MRRSLADLFGQPVALGLGALIAPDEGGAEDLAVGVEHDAAMHLAGEAEGFDLGPGGSKVCQNALNGFDGGAVPVLRILLGPADVLGVDGGVFGAVRAEDGSAAIDENCACAAGADVDAEKHEELLKD